MSRKEVWELDIGSARARWENSKDAGDYEVYAMACAAYLCSKDFESSGEHWFCNNVQTRGYTISSLIMFSFTLPEDSDDPANLRYKVYEAKFTEMLSSCKNCAIAYQCCDGDLMNELIDQAGIPENRVLAFFKELHRKDRSRLAHQLRLDKNSVPVLTETLWSYACMTVSSFVNDNLVEPKLFTGGSTASKLVNDCPGFLMLSFMHIYDLRHAATRKILKPENVKNYIQAWKSHPEKFKKMFSHGLKRNIQAEHWADLAWYTSSLFLDTLGEDAGILRDIVGLCKSEMKAARGVPKYGAHVLILQIMKALASKSDLISENDLEEILDYATSFRELKYGIIDPQAPDAAKSSESYRNLGGKIIIEWFRLYISRSPPPKTDRIKARLQFLLDLKPYAFKSQNECAYVAQISVKVASVFDDPAIRTMVLGDFGSQLARWYAEFKPQWICTLWKCQIENEEQWFPFWDAMLRHPEFSNVNTMDEKNSGTAVGLLQGSRDVALKYTLPLKSQSNQKQPGSQNTAEFSKSEKLVKELLEALTDTGETEKLQTILVDKYVLRSVLLLSVSGNRGLSLAAEEFMKQAVDEDSRESLIHNLVKSKTELTLTALNSILTDAAPASATWLAAMPGLIRLALTVLDQVYSIHDGVETTGNKIVLKLLHQFWNKSWSIVANVIKSIRTWATDYAVSHVKSVLIAVLEFSQGLLSKFRLLDADLSTGYEGNWGATLAEPAIACINNMGDMLQLAIPELLAMSVSIIVEILGLMRSFEVAIPEELSSLLEGLATKRLNSRLSEDQFKELLAATDLSDDEITDMIEKRKPRSGAATLTSSSQRPMSQQKASSSFYSPSKGVYPHQQMSIGDFFKSNGGQKPPIPPRTIVNNQITPQTPHQQSGYSMIKAQLSKQNQQKPIPSSIPAKGLGSVGVIHPEREPGFNTQKPRQKVESSDDDDDDDDENESALSSLGAQRKRDEAARKLREAYQQSKSRPGAPQLVGEINIASQRRIIQQNEEREARAMKARLSVQPTALHKEMLNWDFFAALPPFKAKASIPDQFDTVTHYQDIMAPLLYLEAWEQLQNAKEEIEKTHPNPILLVFGKRVKVDGFTDVYVSVSKESFANSSLGEGDMLLLSYDKSHPSELIEPSASLPHCFARVKEGTIKKYGNSSKNQFVDFQIRLNEQLNFLNALNSGAMVTGINLGGVRTVEREFTALMALPHYDLLGSILSAKPTIPEDQHSQIARLEENLSLNKSQATAVSRSLSNQGFNLIQGPPGTGKTKTILAVIGAFFSMNSLVSQTTGQTTSDKKKILVCAPSNAAVDEIVLRLKEGVTDGSGNHQKLNVLRLGRLEAISEEVRDVTLDEIVAKAVSNTAEPVDEQLRRDHTALVAQRNEARNKLQNSQEQLSADEVRTLTDRLKELNGDIRKKNYALDEQRERLDQARKQKDLQFRQQQNDVLQKAQVVCTTLSASAHPLLASLGVKFDTVIIDEAAQCIELSALIPLKYGCKHCIMVGDPNQLPPTVISQEASRLKYEQSLFVRMFNQYKNVDNAISMLDTQFRMHPEIAKFPSAEFYSGKLKNADGLYESLQRPWHTAHRALGPYSFFEVKGKQERGGKSLRNSAEAAAALDLVKYVRRNFPEVQSIGVISPYREQVRMMRQMFNQSQWLDDSSSSFVSFNSVDGFQGQEKDVIIMSCVRASDAKTNHVGFLGDIRRMNVAITRAKASLWVLGHPESLVANRVWNSLITDAQDRGMFIPARSGGIINSIKKFDEENRRSISPPIVNPNIDRLDRQSSADGFENDDHQGDDPTKKNDKKKKNKRKASASPEGNQQSKKHQNEMPQENVDESMPGNAAESFKPNSDTRGDGSEGPQKHGDTDSGDKKDSSEHKAPEQDRNGSSLVQQAQPSSDSSTRRVDDRINMARLERRRNGPSKNASLFIKPRRGRGNFKRRA